jgi:DNA recombination-dependent growth factor C
MKNQLFLLSFLALLVACAPANTPSSSQNSSTVSTSSPEAEARNLTNRMKETLLLDVAQTDRVLMVNVVNLKIIKKLKESNDTSKLSTTKEKYKAEMKDILDETQYTKFLSDFGDL